MTLTELRALADALSGERIAGMLDAEEAQVCEDAAGYLRAQAEPLSEEQVLILLRSLAPDVTANLRGYTAIVRAVERHHGIGGSDAE